MLDVRIMFYNNNVLLIIYEFIERWNYLFIEPT